MGKARREVRSPSLALAALVAEYRQPVLVVREQPRGRSGQGRLVPVEQALGEWERAVAA